jgi:hypothetical protein
MWWTARAALWGARAGEHCSCGMWGTTRAAQWGGHAGEQSFSGIGKNAHKRAEVRGALAHWDVHLTEA